MQDNCGAKCVAGLFYGTTFSNSGADFARKSAFLSNHAGSPVQALLKMGQGLYEIVKDKDCRIDELEGERAGLEARVAALEAMMSKLLEAQNGGGQ